MTTTSQSRPGQSVVDALDELAGIYGRLYDEMVGAAERWFGALEPLGRRLTTALPAAKPCCPEIPPPCWMPRELGTVCSQVCPGGTATVCLKVVNRGATARTFTVATGSEDGGVSITSSPLELGPMEQGTVVAAVTVDVEACQGQTRPLLLWVHGCHRHVLRWHVTSGPRAVAACQEVVVEDAPDVVHHWYDHFYCDHPCTHG